MGSIESKCEHTEKLAKTPEKLKVKSADVFSTPQPLTLQSDDAQAEQPFDPRSPGIFRTPMEIALSPKTRITKMKNLRDQLNASVEFISPCKVLRDRIIHNMPYNLLDPRSPSNIIPRTPLSLASDHDVAASVASMSEDYPSVEYVEVSSDTFDEAVSTVNNANTTAATETAKTYLETNFDEVECKKTESEIIESSTEQNETPETEIDPRSPTVEINRTPIILPSANEEESAKIVVNESTRKVALRNLKKQKVIFEDAENAGVLCITPKRSQALVVGTRTPLGCVANKTSAHAQNKSVESASKKNSHQIKDVVDDVIKMASHKIAGLNLESSTDNGANDENTPRNAVEMRKMMAGGGRRLSSKIPVLRSFNN